MCDSLHTPLQHCGNLEYKALHGDVVPVKYQLYAFCCQLHCFEATVVIVHGHKSTVQLVANLGEWRLDGCLTVQGAYCHGLVCAQPAD